MFTKVISQTLLYIYVYHVIVNVIFEEKIIALDGFLFLIWKVYSYICSAFSKLVI